MSQPAIFDGHNDVLLRLHKSGGMAALPGFRVGGPGHIDLPGARAGNFAGGLFAIFVPDDGPFDMAAMLKPEYDLPLPPMVARETALDTTLAQAALLLELYLLKIATVMS